MKEILTSIMVKGKDGKYQKITVQRPMPRLCKTCRKNETRNGSAYCDYCAREFLRNNFKELQAEGEVKNNRITRE